MIHSVLATFRKFNYFCRILHFSTTLDVCCNWTFRPVSADCRVVLRPGWNGFNFFAHFCANFLRRKKCHFRPFGSPSGGFFQFFGMVLTFFPLPSNFIPHASRAKITRNKPSHRSGPGPEPEVFQNRDRKIEVLRKTWPGQQVSDLDLAEVSARTARDVKCDILVKTCHLPPRHTTFSARFCTC